MSYSAGNTKISLAECRKIATKHGIPYTDEELIQMRDWLDNLGDIILTIVEQNGVDEMNEIIERENRIKNESS